MKIVGVCCSPRKEKTTRYALDNCLSAITEKYPQVSRETKAVKGVWLSPDGEKKFFREAILCRRS